MKGSLFTTIQINWTQVFQSKAMNLYSISAEDIETTPCLIDFQEIGESPNNVQYLVVDLLDMGQETHSESQKAVE